LTAQRLIEIGHAIWGKRGWQTQMAAALQKDTSTIRRWIYADSVPPLAAMVLEELATRSKKAERKLRLQR
jgi:hypothetical protein